MCDFNFEYIYNRRDFIEDYLISFESFDLDNAEYFADRYCDYDGDFSDYDCPPEFIIRAFDAYDKFLRGDL